MSSWAEYLKSFPATRASAPSTRTGTKGTTELTDTGVGETRVALFFALVRGIPDERLNSLLRNCLVAASNLYLTSEKDATNFLVDLFVLTFQSRDCRGGKGERNIFYTLMYELYRIFPNTVIALLSLIPEYGYYKDFVQMLEYLQDINPHNECALSRAILQTMATQLRTDFAKVNAGESAISLCAKYAPREGKSFAKKYEQLFEQLLELVFPDLLENRAVAYRRMLSYLSPALETVEVKMCGKRYADIDFDHVPSVATKKYRKAFLNEKVHHSPRAEDLVAGNRQPYDYDRVTCRKHFMEYIKGGNVKGAQLFPHEIIRPMMHKDAVISSFEASLLNAQWNNLRENLVETLQEKRAAGKGPSIDLGKLVPMVDVSGSMEGIPMEVAIALGILVSEVNHPAFRDRILTFETSPKWVQLDSVTMKLKNKVDVLKKAAWGGSTNIDAAISLIARVIEMNHLPPEDVPDLIIFSDMQFDAAVGYEGVRHYSSSAFGKKPKTKQQRAQDTQYQRMKKTFHDLGMRMRGKAYPVPRIIYWNLLSNTKGFPAQANSENVLLLSGYSPSLFRFVTEGVVPAGATSNIVNPYLTLRQMLDDKRYDLVRQVISLSMEGPLAAYHFVPEEVAAEGKDAASAAVSDTTLSESTSTAADW